MNAAAPMTRWRMWLVGAVAALLVAGHLLDIITQVEHWPFSYYPMYGRVQKKSRLRIPGLYAVVQGGKHPLMSMTADRKQFVPQMSEARVRNILMASWGRDGTAPGAEKKTGDILRDYLKIYESRRIAGLHDGPPMLEAQLCRITWVIKDNMSSRKPRSVEPLLGVRADGRRIPYYRQGTTQPASTPAEDVTDDVADD